MSEHQPYDDELVEKLGGISLPSEDLAWEDMKRRLDEDNEDKPLIPPVLRSCGCLAGVLLLLLVGGLIIWKSTDGFSFSKKAGSKQQITKLTQQSNDENTLKISGRNKVAGEKNIGISYDTLKSDSRDNSELTVPSATPVAGEKISGVKDRPHQRLATTAGSKHQLKNNPVNDMLQSTDTLLEGRHTVAVNPRQFPGSAVSQAGDSDSIKPNNQLLSGDTSRLQPEALTGKPVDSIGSLDSNIKKSPAALPVSDKNEPYDKEPQRVYLGAGVGLHQLVPVNGQKSTPYNAEGRTGSLRDYLPSVYLRLYKGRKWFAQSEFRYGAPQYTKQTLFIQQKVADSSGSVRQVSNSSVKKTFYHQVPISFNYNIIPSWSLGAGVTFNKFTSAIVQHDVIRPGATPARDSILSSVVQQQTKADSNFVNTYMQLMLQTHYQWRRFSFGIKYSFGLQPYLKFQLPGGEQRQEKNSALQLFIRYELWRSRHGD